MKKLKDLVYDYNDILLAIVIIVVAAGVIFWKVSDVMAYPSFIRNANKQTQQTEIGSIDTEPIDVEPIVEPGPDVTTEPVETTTPPEDTTTPSLVAADTKFEIKSGEYLSTVAKNLQSKGLIADSAAFVKLVEEMKLSSKIQVGTFTIPAGATEEQIAKIITRTN